MFVTPGSAPALVDASTQVVWTHADLDDAVRARADELPVGAGLVMLAGETGVDTIVDLLALLRTRQPVALLDPSLDQARAEDLLSRYEADVLIDRRGRWTAPAAYRAHTDGVHVRDLGPPPATDLALLLSTSGSTGSPKLVRLSRRNLESNAAAIAASLSLAASDRAPTALPLHYSYGLSVVLSHLHAGASVLVTDASVLEPRFWTDFTEHGCTLLNAVPYTFHLLRRTGFYDRELPTLRAVTQAGGKLDAKVMTAAHERLSNRDVSLYVMYGQTEASPRISCLPPERLAEKTGSVGLPLDGGRIRILADGVPCAPGEVGEVVYEGPNVMLGYAERRSDLARLDELCGTLVTGDLGYVDDEGFLYLTGRTKRIAKVFGVRVNLDEVEHEVRHLGPVAAVAGDDKVVVFTERSDLEALRTSRVELARSLRVAVGGVRFDSIQRIPLLSSGKTDYRALQQLLDGSS